MSTDTPRQRLDQALVSQGLAPTRARARDLVLRGEVLVGGQPASKPAMMVAGTAALALVSGPADYVSRGALKLRAALRHFGFEADGRVGIDVGASTGGFTEVLLAAGARRVHAVENGRGQLHARLAADPRVVSMESFDARRIDAVAVPDAVGAIVADVSFLSATAVLPAALDRAERGCWLVVLVKPQFEAPAGTVPRDGIVKDDHVRQAAVARIESWIASRPGWRLVGTIPSPIHGGDGNVEFLTGAVFDG
jgi:23S rRNA (cytidine1920-2'-O)/16S rRNA (cytidine1409-2'-O)-methyltransferase